MRSISQHPITGKNFSVRSGEAPICRGIAMRLGKPIVFVESENGPQNIKIDLLCVSSGESFDAVASTLGYYVGSCEPATQRVIHVFHLSHEKMKAEDR